MEIRFEKFGFFKEFYVENKFIGFMPCDKDREEFGYSGRKEEVLPESIQIGKKKIKAGQKVTTIIYPSCGKIAI